MSQRAITACKTAFMGFLLVLATSCTKKAETPVQATMEKLTPEQLVEQFVRLSASAKTVEDRFKLRDLCQGKLRAAFDKMSNENFQMSYLSGNVNLETFKIVNAKVQSGDAVVHYKVTVQNKQGADPTEEINEREVSLIQMNGYWYLDSVRPVGKDQIAFVNGMIF